MIRKALDRYRKWAVALAAGPVLGLSQGVTAEDVTIGWTSYPADIPVIADAIDGAKDEAERLGVNIEFALSAGAMAQANAVDNLLALEVDVLAINPEDSRAIGPSVVNANDSGVPVVMWIGDNLGDGETASLISSDEELGGYTIAKWGFEKLGGKGRISLIQGTKAHQAGPAARERVPPGDGGVPGHRDGGLRRGQLDARPCQHPGRGHADPRR